MNKNRKLVWTCLSAMLISGIAGAVVFPAIAQRHTHGSRSAASPKSLVRIKQVKALEAKAEALRKQGDYKESERLLGDAIALEETNPFLKFDLAELLAEQGKTDESFTAYHNAIHPDPPIRNQHGFLDTYYFIRYIEIARKASASGVKGADEEEAWGTQQLILTASAMDTSFPVFTAADLQSQPVDALADLAEGLYQGREGDHKKALNIFQSVVKRHPNLALAHLYVGRELEHTIGWGATPAKEAYRKAIALGDPKVTVAAKKALK